MTTIDYKALAERVERMARSYEERARLARTAQEDRTGERHAECAADLRTVVTMLEERAEVKPVAWMALAYSLPSQATTDEPTAIRWRKAGGEVVPLYTHPAPQPQPVLSGYGDYGAAIPGIERPCTCHPDDNPPVPCTQKYALNECRAASEPTEAQIEAAASAMRDRLDLYSTNILSYSDAKEVAATVLRAALAAKDSDGRP